MTEPGDELAEPLWRNDATSLSDAIARRVVSCEEVVAAHLDRADEVEPTHHAFSWRRARSEVLAEARERDAQLRRGERLGWMHGLPHAIKDLSDVQGLPTSWGLLPPERAPLAGADSLFVARIRAAGAVFVGKTNTPELGLGSHTYNTVTPTTTNALDPTRSAGGSSGGAAVSVALGSVPVADGSDFMGSLRNPPGWNGVYGLRPTPGRVPDRDDAALSVPAGVAGPIARTVRDLVALDATMSGPDPRSPFVRPQVLPPDDRPQLRIGWLSDVVASLPFEDGVLATCQATLGAWRGAGAEVIDVRLPAHGAFDDVEQLWSTWLTVRHHLVGGGLAQLLDEQPQLGLKPEAMWEVEGYRRLTVSQVDQADRVREGLLQSALTVFDKVDVLALPTAQVWPFDATQAWPREIAGHAMDTYHRWMGVTVLPTLAGLPVLVVPAGRGPQGLAMGLQLIGRPGADVQLLERAAAAERDGVVAAQTLRPDRR